VAYRANWMARKVVDIPAYDMTREWRGWHTGNTSIEEIEKLERILLVPRKTRHAITWGRLYGGSAMIMGLGGRQSNFAQPLDVEKVAKGDLEFLHVVGRYDLNCGPTIEDLTSPYYGEPEYYERRSTGTVSSIKIHPSRVVRFNGALLPNQQLAADGWGDSILQAIDESIKGAALVASGTATLVNDAKMDVLRMPHLSDNMSTQEYRDRLTTRLTYANTVKGMMNTLLLDKEEEWERIQTNLGGLPDILKMFLLMVSGAADIPATRMLGQSPVGMNSTGESDLQNYYDRIAAEQNDLGTSMERLDEVLIRSATGSRGSDIYYEWRPLWQTSPQEKATTDKAKADAFKIDVDCGLIAPEVLKKARENQLIEDGVYPGFEEALEEYGTDDVDHLPPTPEEQAEQAKIASEQRLQITSQMGGVQEVEEE